jgi:hypothetical protein
MADRKAILTNNMNFRSQAGQDRVASILVPEQGRCFLDIGAGHLAISNTYALENEMGWYGWCIDNSNDALTEAWDAHRKATFMCGDATKIDYSFLPATVAFGSFDIDSGTLDAMHRVFETAPHTCFRVICAEHDFYARGELLRTPMLELLRSKGYDVLCADVCNEGQSFEAWAVKPELVDMTIAEKFRRDKPTDWREILNVD